MVFCCGENASLRAWKVNANLTLTFLRIERRNGIVNTGGVGGMPGGMISLSADGSTPGSAVGTSVPYGNANLEITNGHLRAYDLENFVPPGRQLTSHPVAVGQPGLGTGLCVQQISAANTGPTAGSIWPTTQAELMFMAPDPGWLTKRRDQPPVFTIRKDPSRAPPRS